MNSAPACSKKIGSLLVAALASASFAAHAQTPAPAEVAKTCSFVNIANLAVKSDGMTVTTDGSVNKDKAVMLIASGAQNTLLTKVEASKLGLSTPAPAPASKGKKAALDTRSQIDEFSIGSIELGKMRILTMTKPGDYPEYGALVGADFLFQHDLELTLSTGTLRFFKPVGCDSSNLAYWDENAAAVALSDLSTDDHRPVITIELNGQKMRALIDTAAPVSVLDLAAARATWRYATFKWRDTHEKNEPKWRTVKQLDCTVQRILRRRRSHQERQVADTRFEESRERGKPGCHARHDFGRRFFTRPPRVIRLEPASILFFVFERKSVQHGCAGRRCEHTEEVN